MKLLIVTPRFHPAVGGLESYVLSLVRGLSERGHEIVIVTSSTEHTRVAIGSFEGHRIYYLPVQFRLSNTPISLHWRRDLKRIFATEKPDIINTHSPVPFMADVATFAAGDIPVVATYHAGSLQKGGGLVDVILRAYERFVLPRVFARTQSVAAVYPEFVQRIVGAESDKISFVPPGIDTDFFAPLGSKKTIDLLYVGRIETSSAWKGIDVLFEAVRLLKIKYPQLRLQLVGTGDAVDGFRESARQLDIEGHVTFAGIKQGTELVSTICASRMIVLPSKTESESFGMVLAEAASCGIPAVGSRVGGIPNVIDDGVTGLLAEPGDSESLAHAIDTLLSNAKLQKTYGQAARTRITKHYSQNVLLDRTETLLTADTRPHRTKIIHVTAHFPPSLGGMEKVAENVAAELARRGEHVEVVTSDIGHDSDYVDPEIPGYLVTRLRGWMIANLPVIPTLFWRLLRQPLGSIYHIHVAQAFVPEIALLAARIRGSRAVAHFHLDVVASGRFGALFTLYKKTLFPWMLRHMDAVIAFSDDQKTLISRNYHVDPIKIHVIPNGVGMEYFLEDKRTPHTPLRLLFVGRLSPQKNLSLLLDSLRGISDKFETTIVGTGDQEASLKTKSQELELQNITFTGRKDGDALIRAYRMADVFVLPSEREGMPLVLLEAMAMRLPVIGTDVLGTRDHIQHGKNGFLVPLGKPDELHHTLLNVSADRKKYAELSNGASDYARHYSWPRLVEQITKEVY